MRADPPSSGDGRAIVRLDDVSKIYTAGRASSSARRDDRVARALTQVSLSVGHDEAVALVGESGSGKSTLAKLVLGLEKPTSGRVLWDGADLARLDRAGLRRYRCSVQIVLQDPYTSLNPRMRVRDAVLEPLRGLGRATREEAEERLSDVLGRVGLSHGIADRLCSQFSGGQRQRIAIAQALIIEPSLIVLDEPVSALDMSIRAQILNLLKDIQDRQGTAYLFISHDLASVRYLAARVAVLYAGRLVEAAPTAQLFENPQHPYTRRLLAASTWGATPAGRAADATVRDADVKFRAWASSLVSGGSDDAGFEMREVGASHFVAVQSHG